MPRALSCSHSLWKVHLSSSDTLFFSLLPGLLFFLGMTNRSTFWLCIWFFTAKSEQVRRVLLLTATDTWTVIKTAPPSGDVYDLRWRKFHFNWFINVTAIKNSTYVHIFSPFLLKWCISGWINNLGINYYRGPLVAAQWRFDDEWCFCVRVCFVLL